MRIHAIASAAIYVVASAGCSGELAERPATNDPTNVAAAEAPFKRPPAYEPDPLLAPIPPKSSEPPPTGTEPAHSPTATPPGNPPMREEPGAHTPAKPKTEEHHHDHDHGMSGGMQHEQHGAEQHKSPAAKVYTCPMHPEVRSPRPGKCPKCGMTLVPAEDAGGDK